MRLTLLTQQQLDSIFAILTNPLCLTVVCVSFTLRIVLCPGSKHQSDHNETNCPHRSREKFMMDETAEFRINKDYADKYNKWRRGEELQKCEGFILL